MLKVQLALYLRKDSCLRLREFWLHFQTEEEPAHFSLFLDLLAGRKDSLRKFSCISHFFRPAPPSFLPSLAQEVYKVGLYPILATR